MASSWKGEIILASMPAPLDTDLLTRLLAEVDPALDPGTFAAMDVPSLLPCSREYWIAAGVARRLRAVAHPEACEAPGLDRLMADGHYANPSATQSDALSPVGLLMFKPGVRVTPALVDDLQRRASECGYIVAEARTIDPSVVRDRQLIRRHYQIHQDIAERGALTARERVRLLDLYDRPEFAEQFGLSADRVPVMPVAPFLERSGVPVDVLNRWSEATAEACGLNAGGMLGANEIGDDKYVNLFVDPRGGRVPPTFLLNPHMPSVTEWYERAVHPVCVFILQAHAPDALSWSELRRDFCGTTDPARARPGSLRRDSFEGLFPLNWEGATRLARANNGIHLSSGPVEALREIAIWFDRKAEDIALGRALVSSGIRPSDLLERSYFAMAGRAVLVTEATRNCSMVEAVDMLRHGHLLGIESQRATEATLARVDVAHRHARTLAAQTDVVAVIATGSVARNRASDDSDLDLVIVANLPDDAVCIERAVIEGIAVECEWMTRATAMAVAAAAACDLKSLRESSRLGFGVPVYDPHEFHRQIESASRHARPDQPEMLARLRDIATAVDAMQDARADHGDAGWNRVRAVLDNVAVVLLAFHPLRYQKPKWVIQDLEDTGHSGLADALLHAYAISRDTRRAAQTVELVRQLLSDVSARLALPSYEQMLRHGFLDRFPEFSFICRCLADAASLVADGSLAAAEYTAKFTAGMALALGDETVRDELAHVPAHRALFESQTGVPVDESIVDACVWWTERALTEYLEVYPGVLYSAPNSGGTDGRDQESVRLPEQDAEARTQGRPDSGGRGGVQT
jgi:hypothetical protein